MKGIPFVDIVKKAVSAALVLALIAFFPFSGFAHEGNNRSEEVRFDEILTERSWKLVGITSFLLAALVLLALLNKNPSDRFKKTMFWLMILPVIGTTVYLTAGTVYLNSISSTGGPVHWHADFIIDVCGEKIDLLDPKGFSNRIGTPVLHEHNDNRIHVEGVVLEPHHVNLHSFFDVIGGTLEKDFIVLPTNEGTKTIRNHDRCPDGRPGTWQTFVYQTRDDTVRQHKEANPGEYILSPYSIIPPGDCIIFEFSPDVKATTDRICNFYQIELNKGNVTRGY